MVPSCIDIAVVTPVFVTFHLGIDLGHQPHFVPISLAILAAFIISIPHPLDTLPLCFPRPTLLAGSTLATLLALGFSHRAEILHLHLKGFGFLALFKCSTILEAFWMSSSQWMEDER